MTGPKILVPYNRREAVTLVKAAEIAGRSQTTVRGWCSSYCIGRRIVGGRWEVSRVALAMLLDNADEALRAYLGGDRTGPLVAPYFEALGGEIAA